MLDEGVRTQHTTASSSAQTIGFNDIVLAAERLKGVAFRTPLLRSPAFSQMFNMEIYLKLENVQTTGAFKIRGAYNTIASLTDAERKRGLVTASSGNHAQGVAYAAYAFGLDAHTTIFMPESTPQTKIDNTRRYGKVKIQLVHGTYDDASQQAHALAEERGATYIEPYNDWRVMAGQGTIGLEIVQDLPDVDAILVPVGGGGLIGGIALAARSVRPQVQVYGVQAHYRQASGYTIADGIRVKQVGDKPAQLIDELVTRLVQVDEDLIEHAVFQLAQVGHLLVEGAGAVGIAALMNGTLVFPPSFKVVIVLSGGNMDLARLPALSPAVSKDIP